MKTYDAKAARSNAENFTPDCFREEQGRLLTLEPGHGAEEYILGEIQGRVAIGDDGEEVAHLDSGSWGSAWFITKEKE